MRRIAVLGATGSIGRSSLDVIGRHPDRFEVVALSAHRDIEGLLELAQTHRPAFVALTEPARADALRAGLRRIGSPAELLIGPDALVSLAGLDQVDTVIAGIVGAAGLASTLAAAEAGKRILLANKEAVVMAGELLSAALQRSQAELIPLDSEHNAIFQCLPAPAHRAGDNTGIECLWLTASGGPFRGRSRAELAGITPEQACAHPKWSMGRKISVDSATLMNKGLEVIEAHHLFAMPAERIRVVVHPESTLHSLVAYKDGSLLAQLGSPDMRTPIAHALGFPERIASGVAPLDLLSLGSLRFEAPDTDTFRCLALAFEALHQGAAACITLNAANEEAVDAFLNGRLAFLEIAEVVANCLHRAERSRPATLDDILALDRDVRSRARGLINKA